MKAFFWIYLLPILVLLISLPVFAMGIVMALVFRVILFVGICISQLGVYGLGQTADGGDLMRLAIKTTATIALATGESHEA